MSQWQRRKGIMLAYPFEEKRLNKWTSPYLVQPKLDGERCRALFTPSGVMLLSSEENVIFSVPHINRQLAKLDLPVNTELDGELYLHGAPFEYIHSIVGRTVNLHSDYELMDYWIFDLINEEPQFKRSYQTTALREVIRTKRIPNIRTVHTDICSDLKDVLDIYQSYQDDGYEGIIVRHTDAPYLRKRSIWMMKFKPKQTDTYKIVGFKEEIDKEGNPKDRLGALICSSDGNEFAVGTGLTDSNRIDLWAARESLVGKDLLVAYQHITPGRGVPRFPVFVEVIDATASNSN